MFLDGFLSEERRETGWMRAEAAGDPGPWRQRAILGRVRWNADALRDIVSDYVVEHLGDENAVLVLAETGFLKQGRASCGVGCQYTVLVSTIGIGIAFTVMMHPTRGLINVGLGAIGLPGPGWLTNPSLALFSVALVDLWKGVGLATLIFIAGLAAISRDYYEAARIDGADAWRQFTNITLPLVWPATVTVVILSLIGGLRSFDLIWAMTRGGPGFASDVVASTIYKQYQAGFYGLSTAGNVILLALIAAVLLPLSLWFNRREVEQ